MALPIAAIAGIAGAAGATINSLPALLPNKYDREQKRRLAALQRQEELGLLGLTEQERSILEGKLAGRADATNQQAAQERNRILAGSGQALGGQALEQAFLKDNAAAQNQVAVQQAVEEQDILRKNQQIDEMRSLEAGVEQTRKNKVAAAASIAGGALEGGLSMSAQQKLIQGQKEASSRSVKSLSAAYGISEDEARGLMETSAKNPELLAYLSLIKQPVKD
jgi:hypothetical protein